MWFISEATSEDTDALSECEPPHDKTNKMAFVPSEDSDQSGHPPSLIRVFAVRSMCMRTQCFFMRTAKTDQTGRMHRLICVFAGRNGHFVGFVMWRLMYTLQLSP